jgi:threonine dehydratase
MKTQPPGLIDVYLAKRKIKKSIYRTPLVKSPRLREIVTAECYLKLENLQNTGSFKIRGATNKILSLSDDERKRGVIAVSSGNHGRAVASVAQKYNIPAVICISETVPRNKVQAIRELGAEIVIAGKSYDAASEGAEKLQVERGLTMIHPFDDPYVIAGQGTIGLELIEDLPEIDTAIVPLSGGGLLGGIALTLKSINPKIRTIGVSMDRNPKIRTIGVSMDRGPAMFESLKAGRIMEVIEEPTLADALVGGIGKNNAHTFAIIQQFVDETVLVSEGEIAAGMTFALERHQLVVEGGGAVGIAAVLAGKVKEIGENTAIVISGANVDLPVLIEVAQKSYPYQNIG